MYRYYVNFSCAPERVDELKKVVYEEIEKLCKGDVEAKYMKDFRKSYKKKKHDEMIDNFRWVYRMLNYEDTGVYSYSQEMDKLVEDISLDDVSAFASDIFDESRKMDVVFMPEEMK